MKRFLRAVSFASVALAATTAGVHDSHGGETVSEQIPLEVGDAAPDFTLIDHQRNEVTLSSFRGEKSVVLAFYPLAFTGG